jgi:hypothetical protein
LAGSPSRPASRCRVGARQTQHPLPHAAKSRMMFEGNILLLSVFSGRVIDKENRVPLFLITL